ncbi:Ribosomal RNA large subunit methyltransferase K/L [wastewater metagenome]|uniref:Ribosomal RNA large subunit methyltransferase K/L n=2 Tax=unclassified sequences TaxID=12908 RepID=A0A5B8R7T4_9ZZZZ|nr:bifunctional 23S rRNA (guanine(2069)-N(7))-methyltransferase RlmK/23S rRNA (guanine(2445)-N(2))-methyltransferase RlmL [Arhodomonas aquaeolei]MCS4504434.1 bifunctional 23S rRNA (guanine(2069)-N(7))-methyltransferase RlmK/23S rRNA (guanine(2445)-N(2))-methyltransferase RlmL [Arhodomonas aquaeolei]QEA04531.1 ribosomal RNA large subunit methyltransferase K/L [uncultured organism]
MSDTDHAFFAAVPRNLEGLLRDELTALGVVGARETRAGVTWQGDVATALRACLWSRLASRVLLTLGSGDAADEQALLACVRALPWEAHLTADTPFVVDFTGHNASLRDSRHSARVTKDGIRARFHDLGLEAPTANPGGEALRCNVRLSGSHASVYIDIGGGALHRRGYRRAAREAPLKENLAAALLVRAGWPAVAERGGAFADPFCGAGTLVVEAAMMAADIAPGLHREPSGTRFWRGFPAETWRALLEEARERARDGLHRLPPLFAGDIDPEAIRVARENAVRAGLEGRITFRTGDVQDWAGPGDVTAGLLITNPPWGQRLETNRPVERLYMALGDWARTAVPGWRMAVFTGHSQLLAALGLRADRVYRFHNARLPARLGLYTLAAEPAAPQRTATADAPADLVNRLRKNLRHRRRWARREGVDAFRVYDADLPEYAFAVDVYNGEEGVCAHVAEYAPPEKIAPRKAERRRRAAIAAVAEVLELAPEAVVLKIRRRRRTGSQYERQGEHALERIVHEGGARLRVNLTERLDTGLFLDSRGIRRRLADGADGLQVLNLYCYTGSATVQAAMAGAHTTSVDLSRTYLAWLRGNMGLNGIDPASHRIFRADCREWLTEAAERGERFDRVLLDPPSVSRSRHGGTSLDIQRDHVELIEAASALLAPAGVLYFVTNRVRFSLDGPRLGTLGLVTREITSETVPADFPRRPPPHRSWLVSRA